MTDRSTFNPGTLMLEFNSAVQMMNIALDIPKQVIYLRALRIEIDSAENALGIKVVYLDIPNVFNGNKVIDTNVGQIYFPIFLDNAQVTTRVAMQEPISLTHHIPESFTARLLGPDFLPLGDELIQANFLFSTDFGHS